MAYLDNDDVYLLALRAIPKVTDRYPVADGNTFARILTGLSFQESCVNKKAKGYLCFDTEARPLNSKGTAISSALGLTQVLTGTQRAIEKLMHWPERSYSDRADPQYAMDLCAAYLAYFYNGGAKTPRGDWYKALVAYHDGHYSKGGAGNSYAKTVLKHVGLFDFAGVAKRKGTAAGEVFAGLQFQIRSEFR